MLNADRIALRPKSLSMLHCMARTRGIESGPVSCCACRAQRQACKHDTQCRCKQASHPTPLNLLRHRERGDARHRHARRQLTLVGKVGLRVEQSCAYKHTTRTLVTTRSFHTMQTYNYQYEHVFWHFFNLALDVCKCPLCHTKASMSARAHRQTFLWIKHENHAMCA
jgi:hypothetical protein